MAFALAAGLAVALGVSGCDMESTTTPAPGDDAASVWPEPFIVTDADGLELIEANDSLLVFDMLDGAPSISPGRAVVGTGGDGYLRKIVSGRVDGRRLYIATAPAYLADMVLYGTVDTVLTLGFESAVERGSAAGSGPAADRLSLAPGVSLAPASAAGGDRLLLAPGVSLSGGGIDLTEVVLYNGDMGAGRVRAVIHSGRIEFSPLVRFILKIRGYGAAELDANAYGHLGFSFDGDLQSNAPVSFERELPVASLTRRVVQRIGDVPVVETVTLTYLAGFTMRTPSAGTHRLAASGAGEVQIGGQYLDRVWRYYDESNLRWLTHDFLYDSSSEGELEIYIRPRMTVRLYDLPLGRFERTCRLRLVEKDVGFPVLDWTLLGIQEADVEFEPGCTDSKVPRFDPLLFTDLGILAHGPFRTDDYVFVKEWGGEGRADGQFGYPKGIAIDDAGYVYVVDSWNNRVQKFTSDGQFVLRWGASGTAPGQFDAPEGIALDAAGNIYVVDGGNNRIQKFDADTTFIKAWGSEGSGDGEFRGPLGIAIWDSNVYVADNANNRVQRFSIDGDFTGSWGGAGAGDGLFDGPMGVAAGPVAGGRVFVTDCRNSRVQVFNLGGGFVGSWGSLGSGDEQFNCPVAATLTPDALWIADIGNDRVVKYDPAGSFVTKLGSTGTGEGRFDHPEGVAVDASGNLYVVDGRNKRIQKFAPRSR